MPSLADSSHALNRPPTSQPTHPPTQPWTAAASSPPPRRCTRRPTCRALLTQLCQTLSFYSFLEERAVQEDAYAWYRTGCGIFR